VLINLFSCTNKTEIEKEKNEKLITPFPIKVSISQKTLNLQEQKTIPINFKNLPKNKLNIKTTKHDLQLDAFTDYKLEISNIEFKHSTLAFTKKVLTTPSRVKAGLPQIKQNASRSILSFNLDQGLPGMVVKCMIQDKFGFLWIGTDNGLCRFNGDFFDIYNTNTGGLSSNVILSLTEDKSGKIWLGTDGGGLMIIDFKKNELYHHGNDIVLKIKQDKNGNMHIANKNNGYICIDANNLVLQSEVPCKQIKHLQNNSDSFIRDFVLDNKGQTWLASDEGVFIIENFKKNICQKITFKNDENKVYCMEQVGSTIWVGTKTYGALCVYSFKDEFEIKSISNKNGLSNNSVLCLNYDSTENTLLVGTDGSGLDYLKLKPQKNNNLLINKTNYNIEEGLQNTEVCSVINDSQGRIWIGYYGGGGLSLLQSKGNDWLHLSESVGLKSGAVNCFYEDDENNIWLASSGAGCEILTPNFYNFRITTNNGLSDNEINTITNDQQGNVWIGTAYSGINILDKNKKSISYISEINGLSSNSIKYIFCSKNKTWIGTEKGLDYYDNVTHQLFHVELSKKFKETPVFSIVEGKNNDVWIGTYGNGVYQLILNENGNYYASHFNKTNGLSSDLIMSLYCHRNGTIYAGTDGAGLLQINSSNSNKNKYNVKSITTNSGLTDNSVLSLTACKNILYLGTGKGLAQLNLNNLDLQNLDKQQGLAALDFNNNAAYTNKQGQLWWGIGSVVSVMRPYFALTHKLPCYITSIDINDMPLNKILRANKKIKYKLNSQKKAPYALQDQLEFPYNLNHFTFHFSGTQIANNNKTHYQYILVGSDTAFTNRTNENFAEYRNLSPGKYQFKVRSKGYNGSWSNFDTLSFSILPPWYKTYWAYSLYLILILFSTRLYFKWRLNYLKDQNEKLQIAVHEKTKEINEKSLEMKKSIEYSKGLQESILQKPNSLKTLFADSFLLYLPKDIVAGDFYWWYKHNELIFITAADCTGHGVPGAMLNVICINALNKAIIDEGIYDPGKILNRLIQLVGETFMHGDRKDGMDLSFCVFNEQNNKLLWAGANNPLWLIKSNGKFIELKPNKQAIGLPDPSKSIIPFTTHELILEKGDSLFLFSDGFADQFGGKKDLPKGKKLKYKPFLAQLLQINNLNMLEQEQELKTFFETWKGNVDQTDDVCLIGIRV
jgi:ligand-binding sensor domain-containing protein